MARPFPNSADLGVVHLAAFDDLSAAALRGRHGTDRQNPAEPERTLAGGSDALGAYRCANRLSQVQLAAILGLDLPYVSRIENGAREVRDVRMLVRIAELWPLVARLEARLSDGRAERDVLGRPNRPAGRGPSAVVATEGMPDPRPRPVHRHPPWKEGTDVCLPTLR